METIIAGIVTIAALVLLVRYFIYNTYIGGLLAAGVQILWLLLRLLLGGFTYLLFGRSTSGVYGDASFLNGWKKRKLISPNNKGIVLDGKNRLSVEKSFQHLILVAPTGGGKTTKFVIPNVLNLDTSIILTDPSGEIFNNTAGYLHDNGFNIKVINVGNLSGSYLYNPLYRANTQTDIEKISEILINTAYPDSRGDSKFWNNLGQQIISLLIRCLKNQPTKYQNLHNVRYLLNKFGKNGSPLNDFFAENADQVTFDEIIGYLSQDEKVLQGGLSTAKAGLKKFTDPQLCQLTSEENLHFETIRKEKTALYLIVPEHEIEYYGFFLNILYTQLFDFCMKTPKEGESYLPVTFMLDEFGNMGKLPNFSGLITTLRKRKVSVNIILQDLEQLTNNYGKSDASTILNNCSSKIYFSGLSLQTTKDLESTLGQTTIRYREPGSSVWSSNSSAAIREIGRPLLSADQIRQLSEDEAILIHANQRPAILTMTPFYRNPKLIKKANILPPVIESDIPGKLEFINLDSENKT